MSLLRSKSLKALFSDNGVISDITEQMRTLGDPKFTPSWVAVEDYLYLGLPHKFNNRYFVVESGINEVQRLAFGAVPDDGEMLLNFNGELTGPIPYYATAEDVQNKLNALEGLSAVSVSGTFSSGFNITFTGADGYANQPQITVDSTTLQAASVDVVITASTTTPGSSGANTGSMTVEYWDRTAAWLPFTDMVDETDCFSKSGWVCWEEKPEWIAKDAQDIPELSTLSMKKQMFWVRIKLSADPARISIQAIKFLLSDDRMMTQIYPEIRQYMPRSQTSFMPQHEACAEFMVTRLITEGVIKYQEQIKTPDNWVMAASYQAIVMILEPIPGDDKLDKVKEDMRKNAETLFVRMAADLDSNGNEVLDPPEEEPGWNGTIGVYRR